MGVLQRHLPGKSLESRAIALSEQKRIQVITLLVVCVTNFMSPLDYTIVAVALNTMQASLHASYNEMQWIINAYTLAFASFLLPAGLLADRFGRKKIFCIGLLLFGGASLSCGLAPSALYLDLSRFVQGSGAAFIIASSLALLSQAFSGENRAKAFGTWGVIVGIGVAVGPFLGGLIIRYWGWKSAFLINVPTIVFMYVLTVKYVQSSKDPNAKTLDVKGMISFLLFTFLFIYTLINGNEAGWTSSKILFCIVLAVASLLGFILLEIRHPYPLFDLSLFKKRSFTGITLVPLTLAASYWGIFLYSPLYYQIVLHYNPMAAGAAVLPFAVPLLLISPVGSWLYTKIPVHHFLAFGHILVCTGCLLLWLAGPEAGWQQLAFGSFLAGSGVGLLNGQISNIAISQVPDQRSGMASGISSTMRQIGLATAFAGLGAFLGTRISHYLTEYRYNLKAAEYQYRFLGTALASGNKAALIPYLKPTSVTLDEISGATFYKGFHDVLLLAVIAALLGIVVSLLFMKSTRRHDA